MFYHFGISFCTLLGERENVMFRKFPSKFLAYFLPVYLQKSYCQYYKPLWVSAYCFSMYLSARLWLSNNLSIGLQTLISFTIMTSLSYVFYSPSSRCFLPPTWWPAPPWPWSAAPPPWPPTPSPARPPNTTPKAASSSHHKQLYRSTNLLTLLTHLLFWMVSSPGGFLSACWAC